MWDSHSWLSAVTVSPRPPSLLAVNEPETSLHPDILDALAHLIVRASKHTQLWITTHSQPLADRIEKHSGVPRVPHVSLLNLGRCLRRTRLALPRNSPLELERRRRLTL